MFKKLVVKHYLLIKHLIWSIVDDPKRPFEHYTWWKEMWCDRIVDAMFKGDEEK